MHRRHLGLGIQKEIEHWAAIENKKGTWSPKRNPAWELKVHMQHKPNMNGNAA